ncbi:MAG TPA: hypothetical protein VJ752_18710 [Burkholderiaceae bacterium]|nr:hypothetical protein [Burkholderiaceae bacterium]
MAGEGGGGSGGGGGGGTGGGDGGAGPDASAILAYLNYHNWFSKDGDYTGNAGYYGDNIGPVGSTIPDPADTRSEASLRNLMASPLEVPSALQRPGNRTASSAASGSDGRADMAASSLRAFVDADVDVYSGLPLGMEHPNPFADWPVADPFADVYRPPRVRSEAAPFSALRQTSLLRSPYLLADNDVVTPRSSQTLPLPDVKRDFNRTLTGIDAGGRPAPVSTQPADWQDDIRRLAGEQRNGPALVYLDGQLRSLPSYTTKEIVIRANEQDQVAPALPVPPQQPPPVPDHRFGLYVFKQAAEQATEQSTRAFKEGRYFEALVGLGVNAFVGSVAQLENLMPYNAPDHFLAAGAFAQRWIWYDMRGHSGRGLLELAKGQDEAGAALSGVELALGAAKSLGSLELRLDSPTMESDRGTKYFLDNGIFRAQHNTNNAYSYNTRTNARVVARTLTEIDARKPGAAIYVGSGGHGEWDGRSFVTDPSLRVPRFYKEDQVTVKSLQEIGIGKVLDLSNPAEAQIFKNAEQMALEPGQDAIFTVRAWCFSSRSCF